MLPDPIPLDPPPGDPRALDDLVGRLLRAAALLDGLEEQVVGAVAAGTWRGRDADAATARTQQVGELAHTGAEALRRAGTRLDRHRDLLEDAGRRLAQLRTAQEEDYGAAAARIGGVVDPAGAGSGMDDVGVLEELRAAESARRIVARAIREDVADDAAATSTVLGECGAVAGGLGRAGGPEALLRYLTEVLPGWRELQLAQHGHDFAAAVVTGDAFTREAAARELLPWAGEGAVAAAVLTGLGAQGFREVLRQLGDGSLSSSSALARVMATVLGAPVPPAEAAAVARVRDGRLVAPQDLRTLDGDLVALGMGVVLAAGHGNPYAGPPVTTVREWGRQIVARERALGSLRIVDRVRAGSVSALSGDPLQEVLVRLAAADDPAPAVALLGGQPTWSHLLERPWDDGGAAFAALVEHAVAAPGDVALRSGLRALAVGLGADGDPAGWTVDRATAAVVAPALADAVTARPEVVTAALERAAAGADGDRTLLRGLGYLSAEPAAGDALARGLGEAVAGLAAAPGAGAPAPAVVVGAGWTAVREYGQRLAHALDAFAAQEEARQRKHAGDLLTTLGGRAVGPLAALGAVLLDLNGTWDAGADDRPHFSVPRSGSDAAGTAYARVAAVLGAPTPPTSPSVGLLGLATELVPGGGRTGLGLLGGPLRDVLDHTVDGVQELLDDEEVGEHRQKAPTD